ncbi:SPOSA6832_04730 [Sporobolomyces salmonicolor]|uniref:SPOSA6832_04730-mRNA-1:cds n=1 Tax=Sporidiobolus salmonicolor TaxID=5005 RepID=A0A0D6ESR3_SPOSA|nr:SPOSA6832_04730 [Sporobolomyces salmonicolor]
MPPDSPALSTLPPQVLDPILDLAVQLDPALRLALISQLGKQLSTAAWGVLARSLTLEDDDSILVQAERDHRDHQPSSSLLSAVARHPDLADHVRELSVVRPSVQDGAANSGESSESGEDPVAAVDPFALDDDDDIAAAAARRAAPAVSPLDDPSLLLLLSKLSSLTSFTWSSYRLPPDHLCPALGQVAKGLRSFKFDLLPSPFPDDGDHGGQSPSVIQAALSTSPASPSSLHHHHAHGPSHHHLRWDAPSLSALPGTLTSLSLSSLSQAACRELGAALPLFFGLDELEIAKTVFVDDALLSDIAKGAPRQFRRLRIADMHGTKLSDAGLGELLHACQELEVLELDCVEGRLSRSCWSKVTPLPPRLHTLKLTYSELPPHKSWVLDHLSSLPDLLSSSSLTSISLSRKPHPGAFIPGSHHLARYPIDGALAPRRLGDKEIAALCEKGSDWRELELDLFLLDGDGLKKIMDACTGLVRLKVLFDAPFKNLHLRHFLVSIPPAHTPEIQTLTPSTYTSVAPPLSPASSPGRKSVPLPPLTSTSVPPTSPPSSSRASKLEKDEHTGVLKEIEPLLPPTRDWRRFLKKTHSLERITWTGRGGIGTFRFGKPGGSSLIRIAFAPTKPAPAGAEADALGVGAGGQEDASPASERERERSASGIFTVGASPTDRTANRPRRSSSVSLAGSCLSHLSLISGGSPTSPGSASTFASLDAAARRSATTTTSSHEFGTTAGGGGGAGARRKSAGALAFAPFGGGAGETIRESRSSSPDHPRGVGLGLDYAAFDASPSSSHTYPPGLSVASSPPTAARSFAAAAAGGGVGLPTLGYGWASGPSSGSTMTDKRAREHREKGRDEKKDKDSSPKRPKGGRKFSPGTTASTTTAAGGAGGGGVEGSWRRT